MTLGVLLPVVALAAVVVVAFLLTLLLPARWVAAVGAVLALGEWVLAYQRSAGRDDAREGLALVLFTGLFTAVLLLLWLLGVAAALLVRRRRRRA